MTRYADPMVCPDCRQPLPPNPAACPACGLPLDQPAAVELFRTLERADELMGTAAALLSPADSASRAGRISVL